MKRKIYSPSEKVKIEICQLTSDSLGGFKKSWRLWRETTCCMRQIFSRSKQNLDFLLNFNWIPNFPANFRVINKKGETLYPIAMPMENGFESIAIAVRKSNNEQL
ncbi:MAG: hypothetical protein LBI30_01805 [Holosporales bacterium]|nr:hypothetical protein [Holosporales bacterium]